MASQPTQSPIRSQCSDADGNSSARTSSRRSQEESRTQQSSYQAGCDDIDAKVKACFTKTFHFKHAENWSLPFPEFMFSVIKWKELPLQSLKGILNSVKDKLNNYNLKEWHSHTNAMNKAGDVVRKIRDEFEPEFITQAWCKFYEIVASFKLIPEDIPGNNLVSIHLCEAPGAFVTSLNHYLKTNRPMVQWDWLATTLNPHYEGNPLSCMINDDRFILKTLDHWSFGQDATGNIMCLKNMLHLMGQARGRGPVMLVTADGSIDCQDDPGEQEAIVSRLHFCETVTAFHLLAQGGSFLLKMFTMFECDTICLMYLLTCTFEQVSVTKPATSKEGNSEVYVVCLGYRGIDFIQPWLEVLRNNFGPNTLRNSMFYSFCLPESFLDLLETCARTFTSHQIEALQNNIWTFKQKVSRRNEVKIRCAVNKLRYFVAQKFVELYQIKPLQGTNEIVGREFMRAMATPNIESRSESEVSFSDRVRKEDLPYPMMLRDLKEELKSLLITWTASKDIKWLQFQERHVELCIQIGLPVETVHSSKFCLGKLLNIRNRVRQLVEAEKTLNVNSTGTATSIEVSNDINHKEFVTKLKRQFPGALVLDFKDTLWTSLEDGKNGAAEDAAFNMIKSAVNNLWRDTTLIVIGYPMLTQFNVGVVYLLCHLFDKVGIVKPSELDFAVVFKEYRHWDSRMLGFLEKVGHDIDLCKDEASVSLLSIVPISTLSGIHLLDDNSVQAKEKSACEGPKSFYSHILEVNNICVSNQTINIIEDALKSFV